jgi:hypothetical protein
MLKAKILDYNKDFLNDIETLEDKLESRGFGIGDMQDLNEIYTLSCKLLASILESCKDKEIISQVGKSICIAGITRKISQVFKDYILTLKQF